MNKHTLKDFSADPKLNQLIKNYLTSTKTSAVTIQEALKTKNFSVVQAVAHQLIGSGGTFGFEDITHIGTELEKAGKDENSAQIEKNITKLKDTILELESSL